jgi:hypothetical protein
VDLKLDVSRAEFDRDGVRDFVWPVAHSEVRAMRDTTFKELVAAARRAGIEPGEDGEVLSVVIGWYLNEAMIGYRAHALYRRLEAIGRRPIPVEGSRFLPAVAERKAPTWSPFLDVIRRGPKRSKRWYWVPVGLRRTWRSVPSRGLSWESLRPLDLSHDIVSIQQLPSVVRHAELVKEKVWRTNVGDWMRPIGAGHEAKSPKGGQLLDESLEAVRTGFAAGNEILPSFLEDFLRQWFVSGMGMTRAYLDEMARRPRRLPRRLWTGSGSPIWGRMLRHATRRVGGEVTGHDHAMGIGHLNYTVKMLTDFESCDVFVTFSEMQADSLRRTLRDDLLLSPKAPKIIALPENNHASERPIRLPQTTRDGCTRPLRTVMYPSSFYRGENVAYAVQLPDVVALDWEARLFAHLSSWGYQALHKPHPGSISLPSSQSIESVGGRLITERFEDVSDLADAFIFIDSQSTPFISVIKGGKPVVFVDLGLYEWMPEAHELLEKRCRIVKGWFDENNRVQVDWDVLRSAMNEARDLNDTSFYDSYLMGTSV